MGTKCLEMRCDRDRKNFLATRLCHAYIEFGSLPEKGKCVTHFSFQMDKTKSMPLPCFFARCVGPFFLVGVVALFPRREVALTT